MVDLGHAGPGTSDTAKPLALSTLEFDVLWEHLQLGDMPLVLKVHSPGRTHAERAEFVAGAWRSLGARGLGRPVDVDPRLARLLRVLGHPDSEIDGRLWLGRRIGSLRTLVAITGNEAVLATLSPRGVTVREASATGPVREALSVLQPGPAGPGESVTIPSADLDAAAESGNDPAEFEAALRERGIRERDAATLRTMITRVGRHGQFGVAARDRWGKRLRGDRVVGFFDNAHGRYLQVRRTEQGGQPWSTVSPADHRLLESQLTELYNETLARR